MSNNIRPEQAHQHYRKLLDEELAALFKAPLEEINCPLCGFEESQVIVSNNSHLMFYVKCQTCHLVYLKKRPPLALIEHYYRTGLSSSYFHESILKPSSDLRKNTLFLERYEKILKSYLNESSVVLDVGSSVGTFLEVLNEQGHRGLGFELNQTAARLAHARGLSVYSDYLDLKSQVPNESLGALTAWEVIAHYGDLMRELNLVAGLLKAGGVFVLTTPNVEALEYRLLLERHPNFSFPFLQIFSPSSIEFLFSKLGFKIEHLSTPGQRDLQTIAEHCSPQSLPDAVRDFLFATDELNEKLRRSIQKVLSEHLQSGHMLVIARKS